MLSKYYASILLTLWTSTLVSPSHQQSDHVFHRTPWAVSEVGALFSRSSLIKGHSAADTSTSLSLSSIGMSYITGHFLYKQDYLARERSTDARRFLSANDFTQLNSLLSETVIKIPDMDNIQLDLPWPLTAANISVTQLTCFNIHLGDVQLTWDQLSQQKLEVDLSILGIEVDCSMNWAINYDGGAVTSKIGSSGTAEIYIRDSDLALSSAFLSKNYQNYFPDAFTLESCSANFLVSDLTFEGSISANIANKFKSKIQSTVETQINNVVCQELDGADAQVTTMLADLDDKIQKFLPPNGWSKTDVDPLQTSVVVPKNAQLLDFSNGTVANALLSQIDSFLYVGPDSADPSNSGINALIKSNLLNDDGAYEVPVGQFLPNSTLFQGEDLLTKTKIVVNSARVYGLDTITLFDPLNPIGPQVLQSSLALKRLDVVADLSIYMSPSTLNTSLVVGNTPSDVENITVSIGMDSIKATVSIFLAVSMSRLGEMQLGSVLHSNQILSCLLHTIYGTEVTQLVASVGDISTPNMTGFISTGVDTVILNATNAVFQTLKPWILQTMPGFFQETVRRSVNNGLNDIVSKDLKCPDPSLQGQEEFVDFRDLLLPSSDAVAAGGTGKNPYGDMGAKLMQLVNENLLATNPKTGLSLINENLINPFTLSQSNISGTLLVNDDLLNKEGKIDIPGLKAHYNLKISNATLNNMNSVSAVSLLLPAISNAHRLDNNAAVGTATKPLEGEVKIMLQVTGDQMNINDELYFKVGLETAQITAALLAMVDTKALLTFPLRDIKNPYCWLATIPAPKLDAFGIRLKNATTVSASLLEMTASVKAAKFNIDCMSCSSPGLEDLQTELQTEEGVQESTNLVNNALKKVQQIIEGPFIQVQIDRMLNEAPMRCPHLSTYNSSFTKIQYEQMKAPSYTDDSGSFVASIAITVGCLIGIIILAVLFAKFIASRKNRKWLLSLSNKDLQYLHMQQDREDRIQRGLNQNTSSMFTSDDIPKIARYLIPVVVFSNIALFLSGHLSLGASVNIDITLEGQEISIPNFYEFSLAHSTISMWEGGAHVLAIMIVIFSGIWPYTKQILVLFMWFLPPRIASVQFRGKMFCWLDTLGKWSVIDIYVLVITMVAFRLSIDSPASQASFLSSLYTVDVMIIPRWGLYAMMIAQLISHVSSHFLMHYHRKIVDAATRREIEAEVAGSDDFTDDGHAENVANFPNGTSSKEENALRCCVYEVERSRKGSMLKIRSWVDLALLLTALLAITLFILGCVLPSFQIGILGLVAVAIELGQAGANALNQYSLFSAVTVLIDLARYLNTAGDWLGLVSLSLLMISSTCLVPVAQVAAMLLLWFIPMKYDSATRKKVVFFVEIMQAWQYVEVYLLALVIATWQIGGISQFFFNDVVGGALDGVLGSLVYYGMLSAENAQMFYVVANIEVGAYLLFIGAIMLALLDNFIMRAEKQECQQALQKIRNNDKMGRKLRAEIDSTEYLESYRDLVNGINPIPARFTDYFKWLLVSSSFDTNSIKQKQPCSPNQPTLDPSMSECFGSPPRFHFDDNDEMAEQQNDTRGSIDFNRDEVQVGAQSEFMDSTLSSSFDYDTNTDVAEMMASSLCSSFDCDNSVSLDLIRPPTLLSPPKGKDDIASFGDSVV